MRKPPRVDRTVTARDANVLNVGGCNPATPPPRITVALVDEEESYTLSGAGSFPRSRVSVICVALSAADAHRLAAEVKVALNDCEGAFATFFATFMKAGTEYADWSDDQSTHRVIIDWKVAG